MSRSFKRYGIIKDKGYPKELYNRKFRRVNKQRVRLNKDVKLLKELVNDYCVCDYVLFWDEKFYLKLCKDQDEFEKLKRAYFNK